MIELQNVSFSYPKSEKKVIRDVNMCLEEGKVNVLIGVNGAGKTTLFDLITGVLPVQEGRILNIPQANEIVYLTQSMSFSPILKGKDIARLVLHISGEAYGDSPENGLLVRGDRDRELIEEMWHRKYGQMSVGERKWLLVTLLAAIKRRLYIFDEPTSGVDPASRLSILGKVEELAQTAGRTVLMSTHQLQELEFIRCKLLILHRGTIVFAGTYQELLHTYDTPNPDKAFQSCIESAQQAQVR